MTECVQILTQQTSKRNIWFRILRTKTNQKEMDYKYKINMKTHTLKECAFTSKIFPKTMSNICLLQCANMIYKRLISYICISRCLILKYGLFNICIHDKRQDRPGPHFFVCLNRIPGKVYEDWRVNKKIYYFQ